MARPGSRIGIGIEGRLTAWWLVAGGWWLVAGGWWLVAGGWGAPDGAAGIEDRDRDRDRRSGAPDGAVAGGWWLGSALRRDRDRDRDAWRRTTSLSFRPKRSGVEKSHCSMCRITVGDLSDQSYNRALILFSSYRFRAPLEMTCEAARPGPRPGRNRAFP